MSAWLTLAEGRCLLELRTDNWGHSPTFPEQMGDTSGHCYCSWSSRGVLERGQQEEGCLPVTCFLSQQSWRFWGTRAPMGWAGGLFKGQARHRVRAPGARKLRPLTSAPRNPVSGSHPPQSRLLFQGSPGQVGQAGKPPNRSLRLTGRDQPQERSSSTPQLLLGNRNKTWCVPGAVWTIIQDTPTPSAVCRV